MMRLSVCACVLGGALVSLSAPVPAMAQASAAELLEQARARSRDLEELKAVLNGPDANMRLATFDVMANSGDGVMRETALDLGLASADPLLQSMALKETILGLNRLVLTLEIDTSQPDAVQQIAQAYLDAKGSTYAMPVEEPDGKTGKFKIGRYGEGQVNGLLVTFKNARDEGQLQLVDETTIKGAISVNHASKFGGFIATAKIR